MSWCHNCGAEYRTGFTTCSDCDLPLHLDPPAGEPPHLVPGRAPLENVEVRTIYLGKFGGFEAEIVLDILREAGIFAFPKHEMTESDHYVYSRFESDRGVVMVDASRAEEARTLIAAELPAHLASIEESMRGLQNDGDGEGEGEGAPQG